MVSRGGNDCKSVLLLTMSTQYESIGPLPKSHIFSKVMLVSAVFALVAAMAIGIFVSTQVAKINQKTPAISAANIAWKSSCDAIMNPAAEPVTYPVGGTMTIRNATIYVGDGTILRNTDVTVSGGRIENLGQNLPPVGTVYNAMGSWVTAGLVDMHSHAGVYSFPGDARATQDGNEMTNPTFPSARAIDGFDAEDPAIPLIRSSGVTTSQILPGSGNAMGGQAVAVKFKGTTVEDMRIKNAPIGLKFACGENPKNQYGARGQTPMSRMGIGFVMRQAFQQAQSLWDSQQDYCSSPKTGRAPTDLKWDNLVALLRHQAVLNVHCYKVVDFEMALRVADEFNVSIAAFHHAHEAYKISQILAERGIGSALFSDVRGYKFEAYKDSVYGPRILELNGAPVAFKTDHPVIFGWELLEQAQKAAFWGLSNDAALKAVTSTPASLMGLGNRIGFIRQGYDGDLVLWDRHPLQWGAQPNQVFIEGSVMYQSPSPSFRFDKMNYVSPYEQYKMVATPTSTCQTNGQTMQNYVIQNANIMTMTSAGTVVGNIIVTNSLIACVGSSTACPAPINYPTFNVNGGYVVPGFINVGMALGSVEVEQESNWQDGSMKSGADVSTIGGIQLQTTHIKDAWADGILTSIAKPSSSQIVMGSAASFRIGPNINFLTDYSTGDDYVLNAYTSVDIQIGNSARSTGSVSEQLAQLANLVANPGSGQFSKALSGQVPLVLWANSADYILAALKVLEPRRSTLNLILGGAAEAYLIIPAIQRFNASVILRRCGPETYETRRCDFKQSIQQFAAAGIPIGLGQGATDGDLSKIRGLRWTAGLTDNMNIPMNQALAMVTSNLATMFDLPAGVGVITPGTVPNWVALSGAPLDTNSIIEAIGVKSQVLCQPKQT